MPEMKPELKRTPLYDLHVALGGKMVPFAGYEMPVQYPMGVMNEHLWTRENAGLFDVSHMGPLSVAGPDPAGALEALVPQSVKGLKPGRQRYGFLTNEAGGIMDDLMIAKIDENRLHIVVNAAAKDAMCAHIAAGCPGHEVALFEHIVLLALQGPKAEAALMRLIPDVAQMAFMEYRGFDTLYGRLEISRSGYTGEDGFEIMLPAASAANFAQALLDMDEVAPIGLGARDSLRLEAGLCLYGNDMDEGLNPVEASLDWAIQKIRRRGGAREGGFPGAETILAALEDGPARHRVGLRPEGRAPMRREVALFEHPEGGEQIGFVTSGGFGPSVGGPVAMGIVADSLHIPGTQLFGEVRGKRLPVTVAQLPFTEHRFKR